jgi:hypothetical protein
MHADSSLPKLARLGPICEAMRVCCRRWLKRRDGQKWLTNILAMLQPRPACVLIFEECDHDSTITYKTDTLTEWEHEFIMQNSIAGIRRDEITMVDRLGGYPNNQVHAALMLGFRFQDDASRTRWKTRQDFEMYRDAVHAIA